MSNSITSLKQLFTPIAYSVGLAFSGSVLAASCDQPSPSIEESGKVSLEKIGSYIADAPFDTSAAEIVDYDSCSDRLFVVNAQAKRVDVLTFNEDGSPKHQDSIDLSLAGKHANIDIGAANSVSTFEGLAAVAIENSNKQQPGIIALYQTGTLELVTTFPAGALPDMVSFSKDGKYIAAANEGEPNSDYSVDPEGSVTLIDLSKGVNSAVVTQLSFTDFNEGAKRHHELSNEVRISAPNATVAQDLEPEYLTFDDKGNLFVALQENNALAKIDVPQKRIDSIYPLGGKSWENAILDASNKDGINGNLASYPNLYGYYMPDSIDTLSIDGKTYIVTANEGDGREYGFDTTQKACDDANMKWDEDDFKGSEKYNTEKGFCIAYVDEIRGKKLNLPESHPLAKAVKDNNQLARLKVIKPTEALTENSDIYAFGSRSFSIWSDSGELVFDSGDQFAKHLKQVDPDNFNSSNDSNQSADDRSDDKGSEPEAIETATINGRHFVFIGLERQGGIMVYEVKDPKNPEFVHYINPRDFNEPVCTEVEDGECANATYNPKSGDLGPESIHHFIRDNNHFVAVGNEVSGTTTVYKITL